ncbi:serine/threonine-protein kinase [Actinoplanes sp. NPDC048791]|uniref:serine/threonine-protein kinase n=1 Tax=Actinoplanes sp. NPDC048791 TaxID=3154623 RepID=UPI0033D88485
MDVARELIAGRYRLLEIIGAGGMGRVWLADDELLRRRVAVKEIATPVDVSAAQMLDAQLTTMREARAAARLEHPGVVGVYDVVWRPDRSWIVMEYVESRSLDAVLREGPLPHREAARIGVGVLAALRAAHASGVLHRDVKPHNVLLATDGRVVLTDFGLAKIRGVEQGAEPLLGSPYFVAPERLRGDEAGEAADLWSLGATLYAAVEGQAPFQRSTTTASLTALLTEPPDPARFPGPLNPIIERLLHKDPAQRLPAADAQARLQRVADRAVGDIPNRVPRQRTPAPPGTSALGMAMILDRMSPDRPARDRIARSTKVALVAATR